MHFEIALRSKDLLFIKIGPCNTRVLEGGQIASTLNDCISKERLLYRQENRWIFRVKISSSNDGALSKATRKNERCIH